jgi:hypothetical protein
MMDAMAVALVAGLLVMGSAADAALPEGLSGLICVAPSGARLRLNIDLGAMRFQKEGFAAHPIIAAGADRILLSRYSDTEILILATIDRHTLVYTAQSREIASGTAWKTDYQCTAGSAIDFGVRD